jgi:hypothetical protein
MKKGLILIAFAWTVEVVGVAAGFINAIVTTYPDGNLPATLWPWLLVMPMGMIAVAELGRIPLTSLLFRRHKTVQVVALAGMVVLAGLSFENWLFGFERIVELRFKTVSEASSDLAKSSAKLKDLESQRDSATVNDAKRRDELRSDLDRVVKAINAEKENHLKTLDEIRKTCAIVKEKCANPQQDKEKLRHDREVKLLEKQRDELQDQITKFVTSDHSDSKKIEVEIAAAKAAVGAAKKTRTERIGQNQIYRLAAMWYRTGAADVTDAQFEFVRFWFSTFSAIAVSLAGTVAALVYYARDRMPNRPSSFGNLVNSGRAYFARKRGKIYRDVPVEKIIYRYGKEPSTVVKEEVVKWIDRIVLIPRWGIRAPLHVNSLINDQKAVTATNVTAMKKVN